MNATRGWIYIRINLETLYVDGNVPRKYLVFYKRANPCYNEELRALEILPEIDRMPKASA